MTKRKKKNETISENTVVAEAEVATEAPATTEAETTAEAEAVTEEIEAAEPQTEKESKAVAESEESSAAEDEPAEEKPLSLEEQLELAHQQAGQNLENWQRAAAELANFRRRRDEQLKLQRHRIKAEVLEGVIGALDDMDLAFQHVPGEISDRLVGWVEGFRLVQRKLDKILDDQNVKFIETDGDFDPNFHEAVSYEESDNHEEGQIIGELRKGYRIGNRVLRPALVRVAK